MSGAPVVRHRAAETSARAPELEAGLTLRALLEKLEPQVLGMNRLVGTYERKKPGSRDTLPPVTSLTPVVPRVGAFFDMDKTLIAENSASLFMQYRYARGEIGGMDLLKGIGAYLQYKLGILDIRNWTQSMMLQFRGQSEGELEKQALEWFEESVEPALYPEAEQLVREHQAAGHFVAIVSGATKFVVRPLAARLGIQHMLYTRLEVEEGLFTGRVIEPICFEEGKIYWLQQFIDEHAIDLAKSWFYTDSITDRPLLDLVGHPVAVNPDPVLYREAARRRWPVRFFEAPSREREQEREQARA